MKWLVCAAAILLCVWGAPRDEQKLDKEGFVNLFNGKDLKDWRILGKPEAFQVIDGVIRSEAGKGGHWMYYKKKQFSDFVLRVEWRVSAKGNSGVFIRAPQKGNPWTTAYEVQISCEEPRRDALHCTGALYGYAPVNPRPDETPEKWRIYQVTCKGTKITVLVDGKKVCELDQSTKKETKEKPLKGFIGVQDSHGPEGTWVEYRSIKIKELK